MRRPFIVGEVIYKASWGRIGLRIEQGNVLLANEAQFIVASTDSSTESASQGDPGGWSRTKGEALEHLLSCLGITLRRVENDAVRLKTKIQSTQTMLAHLASLEG